MKSKLWGSSKYPTLNGKLPCSRKSKGQKYTVESICSSPTRGSMISGCHATGNLINFQP